MPAYEYVYKDYTHEVTVFLTVKVTMCGKISRYLLQKQARYHSLS